MLVATTRILGSYKNNGFFSAIVEGKRGIGKSSYALKVLYNVFCSKGYSETDAWEMALDRTFYAIPDIVNFLDQSSKKTPHEIAFIWDDAGVFASKLRWFTHYKEAHLIQALLDTIRGSVSGIIMTCPNQQQLFNFIRRYDDYLIRIRYAKHGQWGRVATGYVKRSLPSGQMRVYKKFEDEYSCYLPKWVYDKYMVKRESYNADNIQNIKDMLKPQKN